MMKLLVKKIVSRAGKVHFKRWRLLATPWLNIYIHGIYEKDEEAHMHDHPWNFLSIILSGGYVEQTEQGFSDRRFLNVKYCKADKTHRIFSLFNNTYTLVITGKKFRNWGYKTERGWIDFESYRKEKHA